MNTSLSISEKIKVGFTKRSDTYTGKLAYVIPMNNKGKVRKEKSFESWRDHSIEPEVYDNEPTSGFVLNKKTGGYKTGWNLRKAYVRVYDPRGFEFEITVENLLYILEHTNSIVGKGLEGDFIYSWSGKDIVLLPANAPEYEQIKEKEKVEKEMDYINSRNLIVGATYLTKNNQTLVYLGKFDEYIREYGQENSRKKSKKQFYFAFPRGDKTHHHHIKTFANMTRTLVEVLDDSEHSEWVEILASLETKLEYSPIDPNKTTQEPLKQEKVEELLNESLKTYSNGSVRVYAENGNKYTIRLLEDGTYEFSGEKVVDFFGFTKYLDNTYNGVKYKVQTLADILWILKPFSKTFYQTNGRLYTTRYTTDYFYG